VFLLLSSPQDRAYAVFHPPLRLPLSTAGRRRKRSQARFFCRFLTSAEVPAQLNPTRSRVFPSTPPPLLQLWKIQTCLRLLPHPDQPLLWVLPHIPWHAKDFFSFRWSVLVVACTSTTPCFLPKPATLSDDLFPFEIVPVQNPSDRLPPKAPPPRCDVKLWIVFFLAFYPFPEGWLPTNSSAPKGGVSFSFSGP